MIFLSPDSFKYIASIVMAHALRHDTDRDSYAQFVTACESRDQRWAGPSGQGYLDIHAKHTVKLAHFHS